MEKIIAILWSIWNYKNYSIFNNPKFNPVDIIEQARNTLHATFFILR